MNRRGVEVVDSSNDTIMSQRISMTSRISRLFTSNASSNHRLRQSQMTTSAFEVPIFMSASSNYVQNQDVPGDEASDGTYLTEPSHRQMPQAYAASSIYSPAPVHHERSHFSDDSDDLTRSMHDLEQGIQPSSYASSETNLIRAKRRHRRRVSESSRQKIAGKKRLAMAFGVTASAMLVTYIALAASRAASGLMFHILSILFILVLTGGFLHSLIRMLMLQKRRKARLARHNEWHGSCGRSASTTNSSMSSEDNFEPFGHASHEKAIPVAEGPDEIITTTPRGRNKKVVRQPPPIYGNIRGSKRLNPELLFWHKQTPSPTTPTYEEALKDVQTAVGFQPPVYVSPRRERRPEAVVRASNVHPLERERLVGLMGNTMTSAPA